MATIFFMPWVFTPELLQVGAVQLLPYLRGQQSGDISGFTQAMFDGVLANYSDRRVLSKEGQPRPVQRATILAWDGDGLAGELTDDGISGRFIAGQWLAFSALSKREFFAHFYYCNSDDVQLIAQRFDPAKPQATTVAARRRDGGSRNYVATREGVPIFFRPLHVQAEKVEYDVPLVKALDELGEGDLRDRLGESIAVFNRANSDADGVTAASEATLLRVAFETLLGSGHKASALQRAFNAHFSDLPATPVWSSGKFGEVEWRRTYPDHVNRPLDPWVQDFCAVRNRAAHGTANTPSGQTRSGACTTICSLVAGSSL